MSKTTFVDGNPALGIMGSVVTAAFLNKIFTHRHDGADADGSGPINYAVATGSANAVAIALTPALTAHVIGMPIRVKLAATNSGASTIAIDALGAVAITHRDGSALAAYDLKKNEIVTLIYNGTSYQVEQEAGYIGVNTILYVSPTGSDTTGDGSSGAPWATVTRALAYLRNKWISSAATVTISVGDGTYANHPTITIDHPCGDRIRIVGTNTYTRGMTSVVSCTGSSGAYTMTIQLDSVANIAVGDYVLIHSPSAGETNYLVCGCHKVTSLPGGNQISVLNKIRWISGPSGSVTATVVVMKAILSFAGDGVDGISARLGGRTTVSKIVLANPGSTKCMGVLAKEGSAIFCETLVGTDGWTAGFASLFASSITNGELLIASGAAYAGFLATEGAFLLADNCVASGCSFAGFAAGDGGSMRAQRSVSSGNTYGYETNNGGIMDVESSLSRHNSNGYSAQNTAFIDALLASDGGSTTPYSPAVNTVGNGNAFIKQ